MHIKGYFMTKSSFVAEVTFKEKYKFTGVTMSVFVCFYKIQE